MTLPLVCKLLRDVRWPLAVTMLLLCGFQVLWVKLTSRNVTQLAPFFSTLAERAGASQKIIEEQLFAGPGRVAQTMIGGPWSIVSADARKIGCFENNAAQHGTGLTAQST